MIKTKAIRIGQLLLLILGLTAVAFDVPNAFNYQAIVRDNQGNPIINQSISLRITIVDSSYNGSPIYSETFNPVSNQFGLISVSIGQGMPISGTFSAINWANHSKWLQVETDITGGSNYTLMGNTQLVSVPYSLYAANCGNAYNTSAYYSITGDTMFIGNNFVIVPGVSMANACRSDVVDTIPYTYYYPHAGDNPYNAALYGLPKIILKNYIELDAIDSISRFRSGVGHDYSDYFESCRSMKHYFRPKYNVDWSAVKVFSPVNGTINDTLSDSFGTQVWITPWGMPAFTIMLFHVSLSGTVHFGDTVRAGQQLGTHIGYQTESDVAIEIGEANGAWQRVSYFDLMTDKLFACYMAHGILSRDSLIISKTARDADTLHCVGMVFTSSGTINNWVTLH